MSDTVNDPRPADTDNNLLRKILSRLTTISGGGGSGTGLTNAELRASAVPVSSASLPLPSGASTEATLAALNAKVTAVNTGAVVLAAGAAAIGSVSVTGNVAITAAALPLPSGASTEATLAAINAKVTAVNTGAVVLAAGAAAIGSVSVTGSVTVTGPLTDTQLRASAVPVSLAASTTVLGNVGGKTTSIKDTTAVSTSPAYTSGDAVGAKRTLANAVTVAGGTAILESIMILDRANQKSDLEILIFDSDPSGATITDNAAFVYSTDDLKVIARIPVSAADYVTLNSKAVACLKGLGVVLKANGGTSLYAAVVAVGTPTFAATTDLQVIFGLLQD
jgi:hypothetical protein